MTWRPAGECRIINRNECARLEYHRRGRSRAPLDPVGDSAGIDPLGRYCLAGDSLEPDSAPLWVAAHRPHSAPRVRLCDLRRRAGHPDGGHDAGDVVWHGKAGIAVAGGARAAGGSLPAERGVHQRQPGSGGGDSGLDYGRSHSIGCGVPDRICVRANVQV